MTLQEYQQEENRLLEKINALSKDNPDSPDLSAALDAHAKVVATITNLDRVEKANAASREPLPKKAGGPDPSRNPLAPKPFASLGEYSRAVVRAGRGQRDPRLIGGPQASGGTNYNDEATDAEVGYLVPAETVTGLMRVVYEEAPFLPYCRQIGTQSKQTNVNVTVTQPFSGAAETVAGDWIAEATAPTPVHLANTQVPVKIFKQLIECYVSEESLEDAPLLQNEITTQFVEQISSRVARAVLNGPANSTACPKGALTCAGAKVITKESAQANSSIVASNIFKMYAGMPPSMRRNAVWLVTPIEEAQLFTLADANGNKLWIAPEGLSAAPYGTIFGRPVIQHPWMPASGAEGSFAFLDLSKYLLVQRFAGPQISMHADFAADAQMFKVRLRIGGAPSISAVITLPDTSTMSPFVLLGARTS